MLHTREQWLFTSSFFLWVSLLKIAGTQYKRHDDKNGSTEPEHRSKEWDLVFVELGLGHGHDPNGEVTGLGVLLKEVDVRESVRHVSNFLINFPVCSVILADGEKFFNIVIVVVLSVMVTTIKILLLAALHLPENYFRLLEKLVFIARYPNSSGLVSPEDLVVTVGNVYGAEVAAWDLVDIA